MANTQAMCTSFKGDLLTGQHNFGVGFIRAATTADVFKGALYFATATLNAATTVYSATGEVGASGSYVAGGLTFGAFVAPSTSGTAAITTPSASWTTGAAFSAAAFDTIFMYTSTNGNKAVGVFTFGSQTIVSGTFTLTMPTNAVGTALIQLS